MPYVPDIVPERAEDLRAYLDRELHRIREECCAAVTPGEFAAVQLYNQAGTRASVGTTWRFFPWDEVEGAINVSWDSGTPDEIVFQVPGLYLTLFHVNCVLEKDRIYEFGLFKNGIQEDNSIVVDFGGEGKNYFNCLPAYLRIDNAGDVLKYGIRADATAEDVDWSAIRFVAYMMA